MVTAKQEREIEALMRGIKRAKNNNRDEKVIKDRTSELYKYLVSEGIIRPDE